MPVFFSFFDKAFTPTPVTFIVESVSVAEATLEIRNRLGLHLRAASTLAQTVKLFNSTVKISNGGQEVNAGSVTSLMMLGAGKGTKLKVKAEGPDAQKALAAVRALFDDRFGEDS